MEEPQNGALNPRAQFRKEVREGVIECTPLVAGPLGVFDCSGVSDGSAAAIIVRAEDAAPLHRPADVREGAVVRRRPCRRTARPDYDYTTFPEVVASAQDAYARLGSPTPRRAGDGRGARLLHATELVLMEDLGFAERGTAWKEVLAGTFDLDGSCR